MSVRSSSQQEPTFSYDEEGDVMYVSFRSGEPAMGVHLTEHILLRLKPSSKVAIGLTILNFSILMQPTEAGPRSFQLTGVDELPEGLKETVLDLLTMPPVDHFIRVSLYVLETGQRIPLVYLNPSAFAVPA